MRSVVIFGPTAVGKTDLTITLAQGGYEVISADSVQVYKKLDVLSAKPERALLMTIPHHLIDIREPWEQYTSGDFCKDCLSSISDIAQRGKKPLISGGTAYYLKELIYGPSTTPEANADIREFVRKQTESNGLEWAREKLREVDETSYLRIHPNDSYRITRALEVYYQTGKSLSSFAVPNKLSDDFILIGLRREKEELISRIKSRVDIMFKSGAVDEIKDLIKIGANLTWPGIRGIGYYEFFSALESGECSLEMIKEEIIKDSIKYSKRQMTFFSSFSGVKWFHPDEKEKIVSYISSFN